MGRIVVNLRDAVRGGDDKAKKDDFAGDVPYTRARTAVTFKAEETSTPLEIVIYLDGKHIKDPQRAVVGVELNGEALPFNAVAASASKFDALRSIYRQGRYAIIQAIKLFSARS